MRKVIAALNMTLDGVCDHTVGLPDEEIHWHYATLINNSDFLLYGRITFELMKYWQPLVEKPSGEKSMDDFALSIDKVPKIVFSNTMKDTGWESAKVSDRSIKEMVLTLKQSGDANSKDILVGSRSIIIQLLKMNLVDELQLCVYPMVAGGGLPFFEDLNERIIFQLNKTKTLSGGAITLYYKPISKGE